MYDANQLRPHFICSLCEQIYVEPVRLKKCGHTFCHFCLVKHFRKSPTCAQCNQPFDSVGHRTYTNDLQLQEVAFRCFPDETVSAMRRRFELLSSKKSIIYQICATNLVYLLQHHISASSGKVRLKIRLNNRRNKTEMIVRCEHDIPIRAIKKLFARKFQQPFESLNFFASNSLTINNEDTISDIILQSGGFDGQTPILIIAHLMEEKIGEAILPIDDEMPVLEAESYEFDAPSPIVPILEAALPTTSAQESEEIKEEIKPEPLIEPSIKRKINSDNANKPPKIRKIKSKTEINPQQTTPSPSQKDLISYFNAMNSTPPTMSSPVTQNAPQTSNGIFATPKLPIQKQETSIFQSPLSPLQLMHPAMAQYFQMMAANQSYQQNLRQHMNLPSPNFGMFPQFSPNSTFSPNFPQNIPNIPNIPNMSNHNFPQNSPNLSNEACNQWLNFLQTQLQSMPKVKKPSTTVKPMRRNENKSTPTTPTDNRSNKIDPLIDGYKNGSNVPSKECDEHLRKLLSCSKT